MEIIIAVLGSCAMAGLVAPHFFITRSQISSVKKAHKYLASSIFSPEETTSFEKVQSAPVTKQLTAKLKDVSATEYVTLSALTGETREAYITFSYKLTEILQIPELTVEQTHDLDTIKENLFSSIRLFNSLPVDKQNSIDVKQQMFTQLNVFGGVLESIQEDCEDDIIRALQLNTSFLNARYPKELTN